MISRLIVLAGAAIALAGCQSGKVLTSIAGGEAKVFEAPPYAVRGVTQYDQNWIDNTVEGGVAAFGWPRPAARPASLEQTPARQAAPAPAKKPGFLKRARAKVAAFRRPVAKPAEFRPAPAAWPPAGAAPVVVAPEPPRAPAASAAPARPACSRVDILLRNCPAR